MPQPGREASAPLRGGVPGAGNLVALVLVEARRVEHCQRPFPHGATHRLRIIGIGKEPDRALRHRLRLAERDQFTRLRGLDQVALPVEIIGRYRRRPER